jgi:sialidase-1
MEGVKRILLECAVGGWVTALPDGRVVQWWTEDKPHSRDSTGSVQLAFARYAADQGRTWGGKEYLFEFPRSEGTGKYNRDACGIVLHDQDGVLHVFGSYWSDWSWETFLGHSRVFHVMSADDGRSWSQVQLLPCGHDYGGIQSAIQLSTGRILAPIWHARTDKNAFGTICAISDDGGQTWRAGREPMYADVGTDETPIVELKDGRVWALCRNSSGCQYEAFSRDGGETWYDIRPSRFVSPSSPSGLKRLRDGRIMVVWNNSLKPKHVFNRLVLTAAISDDDGRTWHGYREIARTNGVAGPDGWVCYPWITQATDGTVIVTYSTADFKANILHVDPEWLMAGSLQEDFSTGLDRWITLHTQGTELVPHPTAADRRVLAMRKPNPEAASGASLNFPFGAKGEMKMRLRLENGFQGARCCLTDHFTWPEYAEEGRFGFAVWANGEIVEPLPAGELQSTGVKLTSGRWYGLTMTWDFEKRSCALAVDGQSVAELSQLSPAVGVCYLRLWSAAQQTDNAGLLVESVTVTIRR